MKHYVGVCLVLITLAAIAFFFLHSCANSVNDTIEHVSDAFSKVLNMRPQITVDEHIVLGQTEPIAEFAVETKEEEVTVGLDEHLEVLSVQVPLTDKTLNATATYRIKAGFDLSEPFVVNIDSATHELRAEMPHAKILSVEQVGDLTLHGEDALLNKITDDERAQIIDSLNQAARDAAEKSDLKAQAETEVAARLREILAHNGQPIAVQWRG